MQNTDFLDAELAELNVLCLLKECYEIRLVTCRTGFSLMSFQQKNDVKILEYETQLKIISISRKLDQKHRLINDELKILYNESK